MSTTQAISNYGNMPLQFEPNRGQTDRRVGFLSHGPGYTLFLTSAGATLAFIQRPPKASHRSGRSGRATHADLLGNGADPITSTTPQTVSVIRLGFAGAALNAHPTLTGEDPLPGRVNYFRGKQSDGGWHTNIPTYGRVTYHDVYPGIDVVYYGTQGHTLEYDWHVAPDVDPTAIRMDVEGAQSTTVDGQGNLVLHTVLGDVQQRAPVVYQDINGRRVDIPTHYVPTAAHQIGFAVGAHDMHRPLVIDPVLVYSTYLGDGPGYGIAVDGVGDAYVIGYTSASDFPTTTGAFSSTYGGGYNDAFVSKLNASGSALLYSTYLGGSGDDEGNGIAVDGAGNAYVAGRTSSSDFPTTTGAFSTTYTGDVNYDAFVSKLNPSGSALLYSTYLGGSGTEGKGIAVDRVGDAYVTGGTYASDFPTTTGAFSTTYGGGVDAFVTALNPSGSALLYSTYLGGSGGDEGNGIVVDGAGNAYVTGDTSASDFPTTTGAFSTTYTGGGNSNVFVSKFNPSGSALLYSTYLGGSGGDNGRGIAVDSVGNAYVTGDTYSSDFPTTTGAFSTTYGGGSDAFVAKLNPSGSALLYSTYLGGSGNEYSRGIVVDGGGDAYVTGSTYSRDFPTTPGAFSITYGGGYYDAFVSKLNASGSALLYSTYLGGSRSDEGFGIAMDAAGNAYVTGYTQSSDFPTTTGAYSTTYNVAGNYFEAFVAKFSGSSSPPRARGGIVPWHPHRTVRLADGLSASVDLADGHLDLTAADVSLPALGPDLSLTHTWDSQLAQDAITTTAGQGWNTDLTTSIGGVLTGTVVFTDATGAQYPFTYTDNLTDTSPYTAYTPAPGRSWTLTATADGSGPTGYALTDFLTGETMSFDGQGRSIATADAYGNANTLSSTGGPGPSSMTNSGGRSLQFLYNGSGLLSETKSPLWVSGESDQAGSQHVTYDYQPGTTQLVTMTVAANTSTPLTTIFGYSGALLTSVKTPYTQATHRWSIGYDALGRVTDITSPSAVADQPVVTRFTYNTDQGQTIVIAGASTSAALPLTYTLDAQGQPITITDALDHNTVYAYDGDHDVTHRTDQNGQTTTNHYAYVGGAGRVGLLTETDYPSIVAYGPAGPTLPVTTTYRYDPTTYDLLEQDSAEGGRTVYSYDGTRHRVTAAMDALGPTVPVGCQAAQAAQAAQVAQAPRRTGAAATLVVRPADSGPGCAPTGDHWRGTLYAYDAQGQLVAATDGRGVYVGDTTGGQTPTASLNPTPPVAATRSYTYTAAGDLQSVSSPPLTTLNPTGTGQTTGPVTTIYGDDLDGNRTSVTSPNGYRTTLSYDHLGRLIQAAQPSVKLWDGSAQAPTATIGCDGDGNVIRTTDGAGDPTTRAYDPLGRLTSSTNAVDETTVLTYTATRLSQVSTPAGNITSYSYDRAGRPSGTTDPMGTLTQYGLDPVGNTVALTVPLGAPGASSVEARAYDGLNQLSTDRVGGTGELSPTLSQTASSSYDRDGNPVQQQAPNGDVTYRSYDSADRPRAVTVYPGARSGPPGSLPLAASQTFALDDANNLIDQLDFNQRDHASTFDGGSRVTQRVDRYLGQASGAITTLRGYDPNGNVRTLRRGVSGAAGTQTSTASYNAADWPLSQDDGQGATTYGYDAAGRPRTQSLLGGSAALTATLDAAGRTTRLDAGSVVLAPAPPPSAPFDLRAAYNNAGISADGVGGGDLDGGGYSYSAQALAAAGLTPGGTAVYGGVTFHWPDAAPGAPDNVTARGQTLTLGTPTVGTTLGVLGAAAGGNAAGTGTVTYADGSTQAFDLSLTDWANGQPGYGDAVAATLSYRNDAAGQADTRPMYVFALGVPLRAGTAVVSVRLPNEGRLHLFALSVATLPPPPSVAVDLRPAYNNAGISADGVGGGNLDGGGYSYSAQALAAAGLTLGGTAVYGGVAFHWPAAAPGAPDNVAARGQTLTLGTPTAGATLGVLGAAINGDSAGTGVVTYADGSTQGFQVGLGDWANGQPGYGNGIVAAMSYRNDASGQPDTRPMYIFYTGVPLRADKAVVSVTLPDQGQLHLFALALSLPPAADATGPVVPAATSLFSYTPDDRPYTDTMGAGTSVAVGETRLHDANDRLTQLSWSNAPLVGPPVAETYAYSYTPQGRTSIYVIESGGNGVSGGSVSSVAYSPDAHGRLLQEVPGDAGLVGSLYRYDGNDNLTEIDQSTNLHTVQTPVITYAYSPTTGPGPWLPNELVSVTHNGDDPGGIQGTTAYAYDNAGNAVSIAYPDGSGDALSYDAAARLTGIVRSDGTGLRIGYNARGLRASYAITRTGQTAPLFAETFTYRDDQVGQVVVTGTAVTATLTQTYLYRPDGAPLELLQRVGSGPIQRYWYVVDGKGDVRKVIDGATGAVVCVYAYDSWGKPLFDPSREEIGGLHQPLRYRGYWYDGWGTDTSGTWDAGPWRWYALPARSYDPDLKRFLQPDPSSQEGVRSYVYCHDAPLDCADPSGLLSQDTMPGGEGGNSGGATPNLPDLSIQQAEQALSVLEGPPAAAIDTSGGEATLRQLPLFPETDLLSAEQTNSPASASIDPASSTVPDSPDTASSPSPVTTRSNLKTRGGIYLLRDPDTGEVIRTGMANNLQTRKGNHARGEDNPATVGLLFEVIYRTDDLAERRGLEQLVYDQYPNAPLNGQRPISPRNRNGAAYLRAADAFLARNAG